MAQGTKSRTLATFTYPVKVEASRPDFEMSNSIRHLDLAALAKAASAEIEIGRVKGGCCGDQIVRAVIRKGMVTGLRVDDPPKGKQTPVRSDLAKLLNEARHTVEKERKSSFRFPIPVVELGNNKVVDQAVETLTCIRIHWLGVQITCCWRTDIPNLEPKCGPLTIDTSKPG
jgi:hypothetical protein